MVLKSQPSPSNLQELCNFIHLILLVEAQYGPLPRASRYVSNLIVFAKRNETVWTLKEELSFNKACNGIEYRLRHPCTRNKLNVAKT
jgi:hypothetical protein